MNILVVFTGGTIGSSLHNGSLSPDVSSQFELISHYEKNVSKSHTFQTIAPLDILSENLQPSHWTTIIDVISEQNINDFEGIILTHGTDTLSFTANALALYFTKLNLPLVLVSSHTPLYDPQTNGHDNFKAALGFIEQKLSGVFVSYKNPDDDFVSIFHAHHITQSPQLSSRFDALAQPIALVGTDGVNLLTPVPTLTELGKRAKPLFDEDILYIKPQPALNYDSFNLSRHKVIVHDLYHSGTCDVTKLKPFIRHCKRENILLIMGPLSKAAYYYESTQELMDMGVHFLYDQAIEHILTKVMFACKNFTNNEELLDYLLK